MNESRLSSDARAAVRSIDIDRLEKLTQDAIDAEDSSCLRSISEIHRSGHFIERHSRDLERHLREMRQGKTARKREEAHEDAMVARRRLLSAIGLIQERADREDEEETRFCVEQPTESWQPDYPLKIRVPYSWRDTASGSWKNDVITYIYDPASAPSPGGRRDKYGLTARMLKALDDQRQMIGLGIAAVQDYLDTRRTGAGIPSVRNIPGDKLDNFSARLLPREESSQR